MIFFKDSLFKRLSNKTLVNNLLSIFSIDNNNLNYSYLIFLGSIGFKLCYVFISLSFTNRILF